MWQRMYLDVFALALGLVLLWRLQLYGGLVGGSPVRPNVDWLLLLSPLALLLGSATILLRVFPVVLRLLAALAAKSRGLPSVLALWPSARDPTHVARLVLLLTLAMALGILATGLNATLDLSEQERAAYATGSDLRLTVRDLVSNTQIENTPGVEVVAAAWRNMGTALMSVPYPRFEMLALEPEAMEGLVVFRDDFAGEPMDSLLQRLMPAEEPALADISPVVKLPGRPGRLGVWVWAPPDEISGLPASQRLTILGSSNHERVALSAKLQTAEGAHVVVELRPAMSDECTSRCWGNQKCDPRFPWSGLSAYECRWVYMAGSVPELPPTAYPLTLVSFWFRNRTYGQTRSGRQTMRDVVITVALDEIGVEDSDSGELQVVEDFEVPERIWIMSAGTSRYRATGGHTGPARQDLILTFRTGLSTISLGPYVGGALQPIPVIVSPGFRDTTHLAEGDIFHAWLASLPDLTFQIAGTANLFPTLYENQENAFGTPDAGFVIASTDALLTQLNRHTRRAVNPNELWIGVPDASNPDEIIRSIPGVRSVVIQNDVRQALKSHPMALGLRSVTFFGYVLTSLLSLLGFGTHFTTSAQQRATMYGILRSLGLSPLQLYGSLITEQLVLVAWGLGLGTGLGILLNRLVLPGLPVSLGDRPPVPPSFPRMTG